MHVELQDVGRTTDSHEILRNIQLTLEGAGYTVIRGSSGSGKTTLAAIVAGVIPPTSGLCVTPLRSSIGYVEQRPTFYEHLSAFENVLAAAAARGLSRTDAAAQSLELFADLGISHVRTRPIHKLSVWERTLVAVARAYVGGTTMIVADQLFDGNDEAAVRTTADTLLKLNDNSRAMLITTTSPTTDLLFPGSVVYELRDGVLMNISKLPTQDVLDHTGDSA
jgi:ABC-type multidrug transport system ATPase subunit